MGFQTYVRGYYPCPRQHYYFFKKRKWRYATTYPWIRKSYRIAKWKYIHLKNQIKTSGKNSFPKDCWFDSLNRQTPSNPPTLNSDFKFIKKQKINPHIVLSVDWEQVLDASIGATIQHIATKVTDRTVWGFYFRLSILKNHYSIVIYCFSSTGFCTSFGTATVKIPLLNAAFKSSCFTPSPT